MFSSSKLFVDVIVISLARKQVGIFQKDKIFLTNENATTELIHSSRLNIQ